MAGKNDPFSNIMNVKNSFLNSPVSDLKGVGPKRAGLLSEKGLKTILDLFYFIPKKYEDRSRILSINEVEAGQPALVKGKIRWAGEEKLFGPKKNLYKIIIGEDTHQLELIWFNLKKQFFSSISSPGLDILVYGTVKQNGNKKQIYHPDISLFDKDIKAPGFLPQYPSIEGVSNKILRSITKAALNQYLDLLIDPAPPGLLDRIGLPSLKETISTLHYPEGNIDLVSFNNSDTLFHKRLIFDRLFNLMLKIFYDKQQREKLSVTPLEITEETFHGIKNYFPFDLTDDQFNCIREIYKDLIGGKQMNRLVMGDVGTGKTLIAAAAAHMVIKNKFQVSLMAPTQLLAEQHMNYIQSLPSSMGFKPVLLTGNLKKSVREQIYRSVEKGLYNIVIGTHSLIQDKLNFSNLGLAIIDEQHRFGVRQRSMIIDKGRNTHILTMSATPIPRTIAITLYGDRDISMINQYPGSRVPVSTILAERSKKRWIFDTLKDKVSGGSQAYIVCPLIDESEDNELKSVVEMTKNLRKILSPPYRIEYIHGQMDAVNKEDILKNFRTGKIDILVSTTVIEVGIHVPNASLMIVEHPDRLGLAQLHQLRGRIGRDGKGGTFILIMPENPSENSIKRLNIMAECDNGFEISKRDMEFRGHGEIRGTRQSGFSEFEISDIIDHHDLLIKAGDLVKDIINIDPDLTLPEHRNFKSLVDP
ncbi:ATP-dependent DNA helicase RecG [Thermodesulfobacteriota bacterium]